MRNGDTKSSPNFGLFSPSTLALFYFSFFTLLLLTGVISYVKDIPIGHFMRDTTAVIGAPFYVGFISKIGILLWCTTAAMCLLTSAVLHKTSAGSRRTSFLLGGGLVTSVLLLDDFFLIHEEIAPLHLAVPSDVVLASYGALALAFVLYYRDCILQSNYPLLVLSIVFLAGSVGLDLLHDKAVLSFLTTPQGIQYLLEDGFKLLGIAGWLSYFGSECYLALVHQSRSAATSPR